MVNLITPSDLNDLNVTLKLFGINSFFNKENILMDSQCSFAIHCKS